MNKHVKVAFFIFFTGIGGMLLYKYLMPSFATWQTTQTSDAIATKGHISIGVDNFIGYFPLCSDELNKRLRRKGYLLDCVEDAADYSSRMSALEKGELDFAVATVDAYVLNGQRENYPGTIVSVLDESKGGDAIIANRSKIANIDALRKAPNLQIAYTPDSPSHHLLKAISVHFDIARLRSEKNWQVEASGSEDALKKLQSGQVDAAVLWEPDISTALKDDKFTRILGTEETSQLIVDILIVNRKYAKKNAEAVATLLQEYFKTLKFYRDNPDELTQAVATKTGLDQALVQNMLKGVEWQSLSDNAERWFGLVQNGTLTKEALIDTIEGTVDVLTEYGSVKSNPLPNRDPYQITNSSFLEQLHQVYAGRFNLADGNAPATSASGKFALLSDKDWQNLKQVGTLKVRPIVFSSGSDSLTLEGREQLDKAAENLKHYPAFRIEIRGHTGLRGDPAANRQLSQDRADAVTRYLDITHSIELNRMHAIGYGSEQPLQQLPGESNRSYNYRLPRVELVLLGEDF